MVLSRFVFMIQTLMPDTLNGEQTFIFAIWHDSERTHRPLSKVIEALTRWDNLTGKAFLKSFKHAMEIYMTIMASRQRRKCIKYHDI